MSNFKVGQKVVYIGGAINKDFLEPQKNEIVTISGISPYFIDSYYLSEYPKSKLGDIQSCTGKSLRPLNHQFAEDVIAYIKELDHECV